jgi:hypothetical protein
MPLDINGNIILSGLTNSSAVITNYPNVVKNGLVLWLDAGRSYSYYDTAYYDCGYGCQYYSSNPGCTSCANQWNDLSTMYMRGTLTNGPTFSYANGGSLSFDGVDDICTISGTVTLGSTFTISAWIKLSTLAGGDYIIYGLNANGNDNWFGINANTVNFFGTQSSDVNNFTLQGTTTISSTSTWYYVAATVNTSTAKVFTNGVEENSVTKGFTIGAWDDSNVTIGRRGTISSRYFPGNIAMVSAYNRVLTPTEIMQNFNADRGRFGI